MPNLLKSLPIEILEKEDTKFIYNILNPLLFEKKKNNLEDIRTNISVHDLIYNNTITLPFNINSREFHAYLTNETEKIKIERLSDTNLLSDINDLNEYIQFYFNIPEYKFIYILIHQYYKLEKATNKYKRLYDETIVKYNDTIDIKKKKIYKTTYESYKFEFDYNNDLFMEFQLILSELSNHDDYSVSQLIDNCAIVLGDNMSIKTFDNDIVFSKSKIIQYLSSFIDLKPQKKFTFNGFNIVDTVVFTPNSLIELISVFAMEISSVFTKYKSYLSLLYDNGNNLYTLQKSDTKQIQETVYENIKIDLMNDNLTYYLDESTNKLELYLYFDHTITIDENTFNLVVNDIVIPKSILSLNGHYHRGYSIFKYMDTTEKYYKITVHDYLIKNLDGEYINYDISTINMDLVLLESKIHIVSDSNAPVITTPEFIDNFNIYIKTDNGFYESNNIPFKVKIDIIEDDDKFTRTYEFSGVDNTSHMELINSEILITYNSFDYVYTPKIYIDYFLYSDYVVEFRYNTIESYVLLDDVMSQDFEMVYYELIEIDKFNTDINKNILYSGKLYKQLFDCINYMMVLNIYNESNIITYPKLTYTQLDNHNHTRSSEIDRIHTRIPFINNLKYLETFQYDDERNIIIFMCNNKQYVLPLGESITRFMNYENIDYDNITKKITYMNNELCDEGFVFAENRLYIKNMTTNEYDDIEIIPTISLSTTKNDIIYYDMFERSYCINIDNIQYSITNLYNSTYTEILNIADNILYIESNYGVCRYKSNDNIFDIDITQPILRENPMDNRFILDIENNTIIYRHDITDTYTLELNEISKKENKHKLSGLSSFSLFYAGNILPENTNKSFSGRENIFNSMMIVDNLYNIGSNGDNYDDTQHNNLLAEQMDLDLSKSSQHNMEQEQYLMFKSSTSSLKGLESYLISNLKSISRDIKVSPVYLVQRNRFISEWARVSSVLPHNQYVFESLKDLVADLMETKLINGGYDDLMDIFKGNEFETFSLKTNNIHDIIVQYITKYIEDEFLLEAFNYYLIFDVWIENNKKTIIDFIKMTASQETIRELSQLQYTLQIDREKMFYMFIKELEKNNKTTISTYKPIGNYSDWYDVEQNNHIHFEKPFKYECLDISSFITMPIDWKHPMLLIRPLVEDGIFTKRDYRFLDLSIATNSQITYDDAYNEYVEESKSKLNKKINYLDETLRILQTLALENDFDYLSVNLVIVKWIVERFLPNYILSHNISTLESFRDIVTTELLSADHPNMIVSFNKIKEHTLLLDLGNTVEEIYTNIIGSDLVINSYIELEITDISTLSYLDKIKKPVEHYFDFLFDINRYDLITKILALFTEDVIASSVLDLSMAINIKNSKGDETFSMYEKMVNSIFDEFLPFHSILDKIIFTIKILETSSSEAVSKEADVKVLDKNVIDIVSKYFEHIHIQTMDNVFTTRMHALFPSEGFSMCNIDLPYDYDRTVKHGGHDLMTMDYEDYGMDDEWYIIDKNDWMYRNQSIDKPLEFVDNWIGCIPDSEYEQVTDIYINDYYHIKEQIFENDNRIDSYFVDYKPTLNIIQNLDDLPTINVIEDYLISIDTTFNIRFFDMENLPMDEYGQDINSGPESQTTLIGMKEALYQNIMYDFYDKLNVLLLDSIWTDIRVIYDMTDIPGHDNFAVDEYYHQQNPGILGQDISVMLYDDLLYQGFDTKTIDMTDISLIDDHLKSVIFIENKQYIDISTIDKIHTTITICVGRKTGCVFGDNYLDIPSHDEFGYDEFYHNSADLDRIANMVDIITYDSLDVIRIDFGFMRMLPIDPYQDLIDQKFYRIDQPGSDIHDARVRDSIMTNITIFGKDIIYIQMLDFYMIDIIDTNVRYQVYDLIDDEYGSEQFVSQLNDTLTYRSIHHDFREHIVALDKYASIIDEASIINIFGVRAAEIERDELFELRLGDEYKLGIKNKLVAEHTMTKIDKDYLTSIKVEEDNFVSFKYHDRDLKVRFTENLRTYFKFVEHSSTLLSEQYITKLEQIHKIKIDTKLIENIKYGYNYDIDIDDMRIVVSDTLKEVWSNRIYNDSMVVSNIDSKLSTTILNDYIFDDIRISQYHDLYGHMGYNDESLDRSIESRISDSLLSLITDKFNDSIYVTLYDHLAHNIKSNITDYIDVVITDSLSTYISIVKQPWVLPEFDMFGHDELPHMYHGIDDEFGITTELREYMRVDATLSLYNSGALINFAESISFGQHYNIGVDNMSVSMSDDLKIISIGTKDLLEISTIEHVGIDNQTKNEYSELVVSDKLWYGYKMDELAINTNVKDTIYYELNDISEKDSTLNIGINDWLVTTQQFIDSIDIVISDKMENIGFVDIFKDSNKLSISIKETLKIAEYREEFFEDQSMVCIFDRLSIGTQTESEIQKDTAQLTIQDKLEYGEGKWFQDNLRIFTFNNVYVSYTSTIPDSISGDLNVSLSDTFHEYTDIAVFKDSLNVVSYERIKYGLLLNDKLNISILRDNYMTIERAWCVNRYGVDDVIYDTVGMEYMNDTIDNNITMELYEDIKVISSFDFKDSLDIVMTDTTVIKSTYSQSDSIIITNVDNLMYGIGHIDYIWDAKEWDNYGYELPYEDWSGQIPHDEIPYGMLEHDQQGADVSQVTTGISDNILYDFGHFFKDSIRIDTKDNDGQNTWNTNIGEWHFMEYTYNDTSIISMKDRLYGRFGTTLNSSLSVNIKEHLTYEDYKVSKFYDTSSININDTITSYDLIDLKVLIEPTTNVDIVDRLYVSTMSQFKDKLYTFNTDNLIYGYGKLFIETLNLTMVEYLDYRENIFDMDMNDIHMFDSTHISMDSVLFDNSIISITETLRYGYLFNDSIDIMFIEQNDINVYRKGSITPYGVDLINHNDYGMNYDDSSLNNSITSSINDDCNILSKIVITDHNQTILSDRLMYGFGIILDDKSILNLNEYNLIFMTHNDIMWTSNKWNDHGYDLYYEVVNGKIPHNILPHNMGEYDQQGDDLSQVTTGIYDNLKYGTHTDLVEKMNVIFNDNITYKDYHEHKQLQESMVVYTKNQLFYNDNLHNISTDRMIDITFGELFQEMIVISPFKDSMGISTFERLKFGQLFRDSLTVSVLQNEYIALGRKWDINQYGVDTIGHDLNNMNYLDDSMDNTFDTQIFDSITILSNHNFTDTLDINLTNKITVGEGIIIRDQNLIVSNFDKTYMSLNIDYLWDKTHSIDYGYKVPYEPISDTRVIVTGITDNLLYGFDCLFKDTVSVNISEKPLDSWGYQSTFNDSISVWANNKLISSYADTDNKLLKIQLRKEQMQMSYEIDNIIHTHKYISGDTLSSEYIDLIDAETHQLIEQIFKYRIYEQIDIDINQNLLGSALFKFDDEMSLVLDYNTTIDLYKEQTDGSLAKSMTVIKDKTSSIVNLFFGDYMDIITSDKIQGTYAEQPDEYVE